MITVAVIIKTIVLVVFKIISILIMLIMSREMQKKILIYWKNNVIGTYHEKTNLKKMHSLPKEFTEDIRG